MFSTVVVGVDGRRGGREALVLGRRLGGAGRGAVVAVHVYPRTPQRPAEDEAEAAVRAASRALLNGELALAGVEARARATGDTSPGRGLHRVAEVLHADVIVVGSTHRALLRRSMAGDTVRDVLLGSRCPMAVAIGRPLEPRAGTPVMGLGYDGGRESQVALEWARAAAAEIGAVVHVLCAAEPPVAFSSGVSYGVNWATFGRAREEYASQQLALALEALGPGATGEVVVGLARSELRRLSADVDLLVLGSRGYGPVRRTLLGSTSDHLVHDAACPVVVVPRGATRTRRGEPARMLAAAAR